ncbi:hypothetical protein AVEN_45302-1 [Araneus ventricosus]|uniref:Kinetochore protein Spc24 n=1 Tax=Araneus ventricosus TaxID=182803 RepID=A0A4Y2MUW3_ARAVE|nr:hypothetical protein AVEN_45302-1 [Araneus ventricosus]
MAEVRSNDPLVNLSWKDRCTKLLEQVEEKHSAAKDVKGKTDDLLKEKKELEDKLKRIEEETEKASKQLKEMENDGLDKPINSSLLKLYTLITKLTFDIETPVNEPKGYIAGNSLETFQFDTAKHSQQFIIDSLWSLIEAQLKPNRETV